MGCKNNVLKNLAKDFVVGLMVYILLCVATLLMARTIIGYSSFDTDYAFLHYKQDYLDNKIWLSCFYIHVFSSLFTLIAGFTQFSNYMLLYQRPVHRFMGKLYVITVLFINVPTAFIMAIYANGGWTSKLAFLLMDILWFYFTWKGWKAALQNKIRIHRRWMIRSFALTFSAITLRTWRLILDPFIESDLTLYMLDAWLGFVPNVLFAEFYIRYKLSTKVDSKGIIQGKAGESANGNESKDAP
jgi:uncharacterized membrane protein